MMSSMISYAQNQEDVVLTRLCTVVQSGSFVDVGAGHPVLENVTFALYEAGWRGINIEPMPREADLLRSERPEDVTLPIAISNRIGTVTLFEAPMDNRGATTSDVDVVARYESMGQVFTPFEVETWPLTEVWARHVSGDVHVLKIDVEGMEQEVLQGADLATNRPWVLVVEATAPNSKTATWANWEPLVLSAGYVFALFDGLNRFYVNTDHLDLVELVSVPANVFDGWRSHRESLFEERAEHAESELARLEIYVASIRDRVSEAENYAASIRDRASKAEDYAATLEHARAEAAPHIERMQAAASTVPVLEQRIVELSSQLDEALARLAVLEKPRRAGVTKSVRTGSTGTD
jgi:FkbM family methyltransferase